MYDEKKEKKSLVLKELHLNTFQYLCYLGCTYLGTKSFMFVEYSVIKSFLT